MFDNRPRDLFNNINNENFKLNSTAIRRADKNVDIGLNKIR